MTSYIKLSTSEYPRHEGDIRLEYPEILESQTGETFPCPPTYALVNHVNPPAHDVVKQRVKEGFPEKKLGKWYKTWIIYDTPPDEILADPLNESLNSPGAKPNVII